MKRVLIVDDDQVSLEMLREVLEKEGFEVSLAPSAESALCKIEEKDFALVLSDIRMAGQSGFDLLRGIRSNESTFKPVVVLMTGFGSLEGALEALKEGAFDYISKPFRIADLRSLVHRAMKHADTLREAMKNAPAGSRPSAAWDPSMARSLIGKSPRIVEVYRILARASLTASNVLISGEVGTGKALVARAIHDHGSRREKPFIRVSIRDEVIALEAEIRSAAGGSVLIEELESFSLAEQSKLMRLMEESEIAGLGIRWIATSRIPLEEIDRMVVGTSGTLNGSLVDRLSILRIEIPPLRERMEDLPELVSAFLYLFSSRNAKPVSHVSEAGMERLARHSWPGNVRELERTLERASAMSVGEVLGVEDFPDVGMNEGSDLSPLRSSLEDVERAHIVRVLDEVGYNKSKASEVLGIDRATLYRKAKLYRIDLKGVKGVGG